MSEPSELFVRALDGGGSTSIECTCGITHMCPDGNQYDDMYEHNGKENTWKEYCEALQAEYPDTVQLHYGYDGIEFKDLDSKVFVYDCKCWEELKRYENWIWYNRSTISRYINSRIEQIAKEAEQEKLMRILQDDIRY